MMTVTLELQARRLALAAVLTGLLRRRVNTRIQPDATAVQLLALAQTLHEDGQHLEHAHGWHFEPAYPGSTAGLESVEGGFRLVCASHVVDEHGTVVGIAFTTLIAGRSPQVTVAPESAPIPEHWQPLVAAS